MAVSGETDRRDGREEGKNWDTKNIEEEESWMQTRQPGKHKTHSRKSSVQNDHDASVKFNCFFANSHP